MDIEDYIFKVLKTKPFLEWTKNRKINYNNYLYICLTNKCNLKCEGCCGKFTALATNTTDIDLDKFNNFFEMFIKHLKDLRYKEVIVSLSGGEITVLDPKILTILVRDILKVVNKYNMRVFIFPVTNLSKLSNDHFDFFRLIRDINIGQNFDARMKTSTDKYHFPKGYDGHIQNIKRLNDIGISLNIATIVNGELGEKEELELLLSKYNDLDVTFTFIPQTDFSDMERYYYLHKQFLNSFLKYQELYKRMYNLRYVSNIAYNHNDTIIINTIPYISERLQIPLNEINNINDIYEYPLFLFSNFMKEYYKNSNIFFYSRMIEYYERFIR